MTAPIDIDALEALEKAATPGPWRLAKDTSPGFSFLWNTTGQSVFSSAYTKDAALIAAARNALPALLAELRQYRERPGEAERAFDAMDAASLDVLARMRRDDHRFTRPEQDALDAALRTCPAASGVERCERNGHPCGTDTFPAGKSCPCTTCVMWLADQIVRAKVRCFEAERWVAATRMSKGIGRRTDAEEMAYVQALAERRDADKALYNLETLEP